MACIECENILIDLRRNGSGALSRKIQVRTYSNIYAAQATAGACSFCDLVWDAIKDVDGPNSFPYCRQKWPPQVYQAALEQNPLYVYHEQTLTGDNITLSLTASVVSLPGYVGGPTGLTTKPQLGGFFVTESSPLADIIAARPLVDKQSAESMTTLAKSWHRLCNTSHTTCTKQSRLSQPGFRLVDLRNSPILYVREGLREVDQYAALSYCWGAQSPLKLTTSRLAQFSTRGLSLKDLPATIRDTCQLCQSLGIPFLWVDCLCIIQDSVSDWNSQAIQMGTIFSQAAIVIRAAAGKDCSRGLFNPHEVASNAVCQVSCIAPDGRTGLCFVRGALSRRLTQPLDQRSWALQEQILCRRALTFGKAEMSWDCSQHLSESGFEPMDDVRAKYLQLVQHERQIDQDNKRTDFSLFWMSLVLEYTRRDLTLERDKLPAIAGLAWWFAKCTTTPLADYIAGLWKPHLPQALLWYHGQVTPHDATTAVRPRETRAPSWSWAAWDCPYLMWQVNPADPAVADVLDSTVATRLVGEVAEVRGTVTLRGPFRRGWLLRDYHYPEFYTLWDDDWREASQKRGPDVVDSLVASGNPYFDSVEPWAGMDEGDPPAGEALFVDCLQITASWCLLVRKVAADGESNAHWTRIGVGRLHEASVATYWKDAELRTLTIA